jgi:hypothetical protein
LEVTGLSSEGLIRLERVMHDGTKVKALASGKSFRRQARLREHLEQARERVRQMSDAPQEEVSTRQAQARQRAARERFERLEQALEEMQKVQAAEPGSKPREQRRVSETDPEARIMKQSGGGYAPSHNVQISTDAAHSLIVGVSVTQSANVNVLPQHWSCSRLSAGTRLTYWQAEPEQLSVLANRYSQSCGVDTKTLGCAVCSS